MDGVPFHFPAPDTPFVMMAGADAQGRPLKVLFDTGDATPFVVIVGRRSPTGREAVPTGEPIVVIKGTAGGDPARLTPARLPGFRLGPIVLKDVSTGVTPSVDIVADEIPGGLDAAIGQVFAKDRIIAIDYETRRIDFQAEPGPAAAAIPMALAPKRPLSLIDVMVNGEGPFRFGLDTGASKTIISPEAARRAGVSGLGLDVGLAGAGGTRSRGRLMRANVQAGATRWSSAPIVVTDILGVVSEDAGTEVDGLLGANLLGKGRLIIDYPSGRVWIAPPSRPKAP